MTVAWWHHVPSVACHRGWMPPRNVVAWSQDLSNPQCINDTEVLCSLPPNPFSRSKPWNAQIFPLEKHSKLCVQSLSLSQKPLNSQFQGVRPHHPSARFPAVKLASRIFCVNQSTWHQEASRSSHFPRCKPPQHWTTPDLTNPKRHMLVKKWSRLQKCFLCRVQCNWDCRDHFSEAPTFCLVLQKITACSSWHSRHFKVRNGEVALTKQQPQKMGGEAAATRQFLMHPPAPVWWSGYHTLDVSSVAVAPQQIAPPSSVSICNPFSTNSRSQTVSFGVSAQRNRGKPLGVSCNSQPSRMVPVLPNCKSKGQVAQCVKLPPYFKQNKKLVWQSVLVHCCWKQNQEHVFEKTDQHSQIYSNILESQSINPQLRIEPARQTIPAAPAEAGSSLSFSTGLWMSLNPLLHYLECLVLWSNNLGPSGSPVG